MSLEHDVAMWRGVSLAGLGRTWAADAKMTGNTTNCTVQNNNVFRHVRTDIDWDGPGVHGDMMVRIDRPWSAIERAVEAGLGPEVDVDAPLEPGKWYFVQDWYDDTPGAPSGGHQYLVRATHAGRYKVQSARSEKRGALYRVGLCMPRVGGRPKRRCVEVQAIPPGPWRGEGHALG